MAVLLLADVIDGVLGSDALAKSITAVMGLGAVHVLVIGPDEAAQKAAAMGGVAKVLHAEDPGYGLAEPMADLIVSIAGDYSHIAAAATAFSKNTLPRVAALLDVMIMTDVTKVVDPDHFVRPIYAGNIIQTIQSTDPIKVFTLRSSAFTAHSGEGRAEIQQLTIPVSAHSVWIGQQSAGSERPDLTSARIVVSGGRGIGSEQNFALIGALADKIGGAVGASRAAVDSGFAPNDLQVGQTGKIVAPDLYVAVGISGAIQHLAGMKDSKVIVAINKDEEAPIFQVADYSLVGDLFTLVPEMTEKL